MLAELFKSAKPKIEGGLRLVEVDASTAQEPGAKGTTNRVHYAFDLMSMTAIEAKVTTDKDGETLAHFNCLRAGDVVIMDRGYNQPKMLIPAINRGIDIILRYNAHGMNLWKREENQIEAFDGLMKQDVMSLLKANEDNAFCAPVFLIHESTAMPCYLHAVPLPKEKAEEAKRKVKERSAKKGRTASKEAIYTSGWVLLLTTLPPSVLSTEAIGEFYRNRWQIELAFKRLKSIINIDRLRAFKGSKTADLYLHAKLLYAVLIEKILQSRFGIAKYKFDEERELSMWRLTKTAHEQLKASIIQVFPMIERFIPAMLKSLTERKRKRQLQKPPNAVQDLMKWCQRDGVYYA